MRLQPQNVICTLAAIVLTPFFWILLFTGSDLSEIELMEKQLAELRDRLHYAESLNHDREHDVHNLRKQVKLLLGVHQHGNRSQQGEMVLPREAHDLLFNMSLGNADMSIPNMFHYMPHLIGKPEAIKPGLKYSRGRAGVSVVIGVPTIKRERGSYLIQTLQSLIESLDEDEQLDCIIVVLISEAGEQRAFCPELPRFPVAMSSGLLEVIAPSHQYYPVLNDLRDTFGDSIERVRWRAKQNLDYTYLMMYARSRGTYYVQLEDDVITKPGYFSTMKNFALNQRTEWIILEFSHLGFIGKMFKSTDLPFVVEFFLMFYKDKPVDWLLDHLLYVKVCNPEKDNKHCARSMAELRHRFKPSLFQHIGTHSSLKGKVQKLKDKDFGKGMMHRPHLNPNAEVTTSLKVYDQYSLDRAYMGETFFWGVLPQQGDFLSFAFNPPIRIYKYLFHSGNPEHPGDRFYNTTIEVLPAKRPSIADEILDSREPSGAPAGGPQFSVTEDGFVPINRFAVDSGVVEGTVLEALGNIEVLRLYVQSNSESWVILSEIFIDDKPPPSPR